MSEFLQDVIKGLSSPHKYLHSKYFYDAKGDVLFQKIMQSEEYYPTTCELEIFKEQTKGLAACFTNELNDFDIVELGAGDATKSFYLLEELIKQQRDFTYFPVDISENVIALLQDKLPARLPELKMKGLNGEYFEMLLEANDISKRKKAVLFLGSNIGNIPINETPSFCRQLRAALNTGDLVLIGFDLQKDPEIILRAYNDKAGYTRDFNLNLLHRINKELSGNFNTSLFKHFPIYDPGTGSCKSYLISMEEQQVEVADHTFHFNKYEEIFMEVSQKYRVSQIKSLAEKTGFKSLNYFFDSKQWFVDAVWQCI